MRPSTNILWRGPVRSLLSNPRPISSLYDNSLLFALPRRLPAPVRCLAQYRLFVTSTTPMSGSAGVDDVVNVVIPEDKIDVQFSRSSGRVRNIAVF
jgi:hypothetical protein